MAAFLIGRLGIRARLTVWYALALAAALLVLSTATYVSMRQTLYSDLDNDLRQNTEALAERLDHEFEEGDPAAYASASVVRKSLFRNLSLEIYDDDRTLLAATDDLSGSRLGANVDFAEVPAVRSGIARFGPVESPLDPNGVEIAVIGVRHPADGRTYVLVAGAGRSEVEAALGSIRRPAIWLLPLLLALAVSGGWLLARRALSPVAAMAEQARRMGADRLGDRLVVANPGDELGVLATTFNELLDRLESAFERMRQFMADASHEVRTPVGVIRSGAAVALTQPVTLDECVETLEVILDQTSRLSRLVDDMFLVARADAGAAGAERRERVDLGELVASCMRTASPLAAERGVELDSDPVRPDGAACLGDRSRLEQMLLNLVVNGINHVRRGDRVSVKVGAADRAGVAAWRIDVVDNGPGIPEDQRDAVFERFVRLDGSRSRDTGGSGLGLPIAKLIAEAHDGSIDLAEAEGGGCVFTVTLPAAPAAGPPD